VYVELNHSGSFVVVFILNIPEIGVGGLCAVLPTGITAAPVPFELPTSREVAVTEPSNKPELAILLIAIYFLVFLLFIITECV
jgi:hypothetical protein